MEELPTNYSIDQHPLKFRGTECLTCGHILDLATNTAQIAHKYLAPKNHP
ncbi:hypothetical protein [Sediminicola arcticus]|jgi:hypothetical protein|uniref:Transposase n=1 Tax=Sediminicola arcticus TaxID=1574308 RepID=A0ABV2SY01_9FLAO